MTETLLKRVQDSGIHSSILASSKFFIDFRGLGWLGGAKVLGKLSVLGRPTNLDYSRVGWLVVFGLNGPLRQYFSLYRAVSQREGERKEK